MYYVYILKSLNHNQIYTGFTKDIETRLKDHNDGKSPHTSKFKPWKVVTYISFASESNARQFEKYLKTGSGIAFSRKHLL
jgi:putative endonuclease